MNQHLQSILDLIQSSVQLTDEQKTALLKSVKAADKDLEITTFKLDRTDKVKTTTAILLEETIQELEHKRKAVEDQNRELAIESSLERVRTVALGMNRPDDMLAVCRIIAGQLQQLDVHEVRNVQTAIFYKEKEVYINYEYYAKHDKTIITEVGYKTHDVQRNFAEQMLKGSNEVFRHSFRGQDVQDWLQFQKTTNVFIDTHLEKASSLDYYWYSLGPVALGLSTYKPLEEGEQKLFRRFLKVFELAYRRYLDIEKAEAQAKEVQVELSLERVRARTMAMQRSDELSETAYLLYQQFQELRQNPEQLSIGIINEAERTVELWLTLQGGKMKEMVQVSFDEPFVISKAYAAWKEQKKSLVIDIYGDDLKRYNAYRNNLNNGITVNNDRTEDRRVINFAFFSKGALSVAAPEPLSDEGARLLERFAKVFEQTYTRFLDLKKAEAQAREGQIELALERVRAKTMAMHNSADVGDTVAIMFDEVVKLGIETIRCGIGIMHDGGEMEVWTAKPNEHGIVDLIIGRMDMMMHPLLKGAYNSWRENKQFYTYELKDDDLIRYFTSINDHPDYPIKYDLASLPSRIVHSEFHFTEGTLFVFSLEELSAETQKIFKRFAGVFGQTYRRYLDLQQAETQAREARIEAALERVRSKAMAMYNSQDLADTIGVFYKELQSFSMTPRRCGVGLLNKENKEVELYTWNNTEKGEDLELVGKLKMQGHPVLENVYNNWITQTEYHPVLRGNEIKKYYEILRPQMAFPDYDHADIQYGYFFFFKEGGVYAWTEKEMGEDELQIYRRFVTVLSLTYNRYKDLQKAEVQARESHIQLALERARTQSMLMQHSKELDDMLRVFHEQVLLLGIPSAFSFLWLPDEENDRHIFWAAWRENKIGHAEFKSKAINYPLDRNEPATKQCLIDWKSNEPVYSYHVPPAAVANYFAAWQELIDGVEQLKPEYFSGGLYYVEAFMKYGCFGVIVSSDLTEGEKNILGRFAIEFERTYRRFLDLQKAEAQVKEAQIEAALEKVRSRSLAMHKSEEIIEVVRAVFERLNDLNIELNTAFIIVFKQGSRDTEWWLINRDKGEYSNILVKYADVRILKNIFEIKEQGTELFSGTFHAEEKNELFRYLFTQTDFKYAPAERQKYIFDREAVSISMAMTDKIAIQITRHDETAFSEETNDIVKRFTKVFDQAYTRFRDLQKAEAQTREAQTEAAMEKVRSRALAMQKPSELVEVAQLLRKEMNLLGVEELETSSIYIHHEDTGKTECWYAIKDVSHPDKELVADHMTIDLPDTWVGKKMLEFYRSGKKKISIPMRGEHRKEWINYCADHSKVLAGFYGDEIPDRIYHLYKFSNGYMGAASPGDISTESWDLLQRATAVFSLAYTRFSDLQHAEAQAKEANIEASLERVRSRTLAMQTSNELAETAAVLFRQLIGLGIEPNRLYITIMKDQPGDMEFWITDEDGTRVGDKFSGNAYRNMTFQKMYEGWTAHKKSITIDMQGEELAAYLNHLTELGVPFKLGLAQKRRVQNIAYFGKGFIGMASPDEQPEESVNLLERFAAVFNLTYTRFNDLQIAEAHAVQAAEDLVKLQTEKKRAEETLTELRETQKQLIQSEKMASLGELTAGIAHEIQNPLNFVNNFSEVSNELIDEMNAEIEKGDMEEARAIAHDIKQNLEKINHHGKRADAIVKGMLQHSRTSSAIKEPTDINKLADEYLRLAYHGLRAKDKTFNATLKTAYDESIGDIFIIPQDIGRVVLNLIINAFYAVTEKKSQQSNGYEPTVSVITKNAPGEVEVIVKDNGNGIPKHVLDKIFQPFFTTKPTGQGTGLGLSLAYDIIKAHGGSLTVETQENEGSEFIIQLPVTK